MCKVHNTVGSLTHIKTRLLQNNIHDFNSTNDLLRFQKTYDASRQQIVENQKALLEVERNNLSSGILELEVEIANDKKELQQKFNNEVDRLRQQYDALAEVDKTILQEFTHGFKALYILSQITYKKLVANNNISRAIKPKVDMLDGKRKRFDYLVSHFEEAATASVRLALNEIDHKKQVIDEINTFIYGAIGEQKVVDELKQLPDEYVLINDFNYSFTKPLFNKQERGYIKTIQIDHLLISPAGIFLIETKNWSKESLKNLNLRSPVEQIKRTRFALNTLLHRNSRIGLAGHHWGERKIPIRNLIVLINNKPQEEFEYVKILTLADLRGYIEYFNFKPSLTKEETQEIADYLIGVNSQVLVESFAIS